MSHDLLIPSDQIPLTPNSRQAAEVRQAALVVAYDPGNGQGAWSRRVRPAPVPAAHDPGSPQARPAADLPRASREDQSATSTRRGPAADHPAWTDRTRRHCWRRRGAGRRSGGKSHAQSSNPRRRGHQPAEPRPAHIPGIVAAGQLTTPSMARTGSAQQCGPSRRARASWRRAPGQCADRAAAGTGRPRCPAGHAAFCVARRRLRRAVGYAVRAAAPGGPADPARGRFTSRRAVRGSSPRHRPATVGPPRKQRS